MTQDLPPQDYESLIRLIHDRHPQYEQNTSTNRNISHTEP